MQKPTPEKSGWDTKRIPRFHPGCSPGAATHCRCNGRARLRLLKDLRRSGSEEVRRNCAGAWDSSTMQVPLWPSFTGQSFVIAIYFAQYNTNLPWCQWENLRFFGTASCVVNDVAPDSTALARPLWTEVFLIAFRHALLAAIYQWRHTGPFAPLAAYCSDRGWFF